MEMKVYNPQKGRLETVDVEFTNDNTTWLSNCRNARDISMIADFDGDILISEFDYTYPLRTYDLSRADIGYDQKKARQRKRGMITPFGRFIDRGIQGGKSTRPYSMTAPPVFGEDHVLGFG